MGSSTALGTAAFPDLILDRTYPIRSTPPQTTANPAIASAFSATKRQIAPRTATTAPNDQEDRSAIRGFAPPPSHIRNRKMSRSDAPHSAPWAIFARHTTVGKTILCLRNRCCLTSPVFLRHRLPQQNRPIADLSNPAADSVDAKRATGELGASHSHGQWHRDLRPLARDPAAFSVSRTCVQRATSNEYSPFTRWVSSETACQLTV